MAKGAAAAAKAARKAERRAGRLVANDGRVGELLDEPVLARLQDWDLLVCDDCGLEQATGAGACFVCGCVTATGADLRRVAESKNSLRKFSA